MITLWNAIGIIIVALGGTALGYLLTAIIDDFRTKKA